ncbi:MAG: tyrosine-type recombinase/integrase [Bacteroidota bacterium]
MGQKNSKGSVTITNDNNRIRLRWGYLGKRYSLNLFQYTKTNFLQAKKLALDIEQDIVNNEFDFTLSRYNGKPEIKIVDKKTAVQYFEEWTINYRQMDCNVNSDYNSLRGMLRKWGDIREDNILNKLNNETFCASTYNRRLTLLKAFSKWLVKQSIWISNPFDDVSNKKYKKVKQSTRKPLTIDEIKLVLNAFKNDTYCPKYSAFKHSHYYPFMYFMFKTGVRNAEAIGLRVGSIDTVQKQIHIKEVLARSLKGTSSKQRIRKETKNGKERVLPLTQDMEEILLPIIKKRKVDDLVFISPEGKPIDDNNFRTRVFKKILRDLGIEERVLYACRHTFGSRCIDEGLTPVMTAFLMGNNPETALRNYTHQITIPTNLPEI